MVLFQRVPRDGESEFSPRTKVICEKNRYIYIERKRQHKRVLGLANGSLGYIQADGKANFEDLNYVEKEFGLIPDERRKLQNEISSDNLSLEEK